MKIKIFERKLCEKYKKNSSFYKVSYKQTGAVLGKDCHKLIKRFKTK